MPKRVTLKQIAEHLGISISTVSRVLSGQASSYRISRKTERAVLRAAKRFRYTPNQLARGLRTNRTNCIGVVIPDISNPFFAGIVHHIEMEARQSGYSIMLCDSNETTELEIESLRLLQSRKVDGMIVLPVGNEGDHIQELLEFGMPVVIADRRVTVHGIPSVVSDNYHGACEGVSHLIGAGHRTIACIQGLPFAEPCRERIRGYREAHARAGLLVDESLIVGDSFTEKNGYIETRLLLKRANRPTAIFTQCLRVALGAIRAIYEEDLRIPEDISLITFDDQPYSSLLATPLTTVTQQLDEIGRLAVKKLFEQMRSEGAVVDGETVVPTALVKRDSVAALEAAMV